VGLISTSVLFFFPGAVASFFVKAEDVMLLREATRAIRLFCFAYLFRWFAVTTQGFLSAIEKPIPATVMSVSVSLLFPVLVLGALWTLGLDGIWINFVFVNLFSSVLGIFLLLRVKRQIKRQGNAGEES
jgi:Na+-driven multidrug efflux pump